VIQSDGCQFLGCEDVANRHVVVPTDPIPTDVFLCPSHDPYIRTAIDSQPTLVRVQAAEGGDRARVWVWRPPRGV
jgi:hypothetical protein